MCGSRRSLSVPPRRLGRWPRSAMRRLQSAIWRSSSSVTPKLALPTSRSPTQRRCKRATPPKDRWPKRTKRRLPQKGLRSKLRKNPSTKRDRRPRRNADWSSSRAPCARPKGEPKEQRQLARKPTSSSRRPSERPRRLSSSSRARRKEAVRRSGGFAFWEKIRPRHRNEARGWGKRWGRVAETPKKPVLRCRASEGEGKRRKNG